MKCEHNHNHRFSVLFCTCVYLSNIVKLDKEKFKDKTNLNLV